MSGGSGGHHDLVRENGLLERLSLLASSYRLRDIFVGGSLLDVYSIFCWFEMLHVRSTTPDSGDFLWSGDEDEVLVYHVYYDAFVSGLSTVEFDADASDFYGGHRDDLVLVGLCWEISHLRFRHSPPMFLRSLHHSCCIYEDPRGVLYGP